MNITLKKKQFTTILGFRSTALSAVVFMGIVTSPAQAVVLSFNFSQSGWTGGGKVTGMFSGEDINGDGFIDITSNEVFSYMMELKGNAIVPDFTHNLNNLQFFRYTLGSDGFPPSFPLFSNNSSFFYDADDKVIGDNPPFIGRSITTALAAAVVVKVVPEPSSTLSILALGTLGAASTLKRKLKPSKLSEKETEKVS